MSIPLIHPDMMEMEGHRFTVPVQIQAMTGTDQDDFGQEQEVWTTVISGFATMAPLSGDELQAASYTASTKAWWVDLNGDYPQITNKHRMKISGETYDIDHADPTRPGYAETTTRLRVSQATT